MNAWHNLNERGLSRIEYLAMTALCAGGIAVSAIATHHSSTPQHTPSLGTKLQQTAGPDHEVIETPATHIYTVEPVASPSSTRITVRPRSSMGSRSPR